MSNKRNKLNIKENWDKELTLSQNSLENIKAGDGGNGGPGDLHSCKCAGKQTCNDGYVGNKTAVTHALLSNCPNCPASE